MVFGTDYFMRGSRFMRRTIEFLDSLDITSAEREMAERDASRQAPARNLRFVLELFYRGLSAHGTSDGMLRLILYAKSISFRPLIAV
jgi:hypothetical protein